MKGAKLSPGAQKTEKWTGTEILVLRQTAVLSGFVHLCERLGVVFVIMSPTGNEVLEKQVKRIFIGAWVTWNSQDKN